MLLSSWCGLLNWTLHVMLLVCPVILWLQSFEEYFKLASVANASRTEDADADNKEMSKVG